MNIGFLGRRSKALKITLIFLRVLVKSFLSSIKPALIHRHSCKNSASVSVMGTLSRNVAAAALIPFWNGLDKTRLQSVSESSSGPVSWLRRPSRYMHGGEPLSDLRWSRRCFKSLYNKETRETGEKSYRNQTEQNHIIITLVIAAAAAAGGHLRHAQEKFNRTVFPEYGGPTRTVATLGSSSARNLKCSSSRTLLKKAPCREPLPSLNASSIKPALRRCCKVGVFRSSDGLKRPDRPKLPWDGTGDCARRGTAFLKLGTASVSMVQVYGTPNLAFNLDLQNQKDSTKCLRLLQNRDSRLIVILVGHKTSSGVSGSNPPWLELFLFSKTLVSLIVWIKGHQDR